MNHLSDELRTNFSTVLMEYLNAGDWKALFTQTGCEEFAQQNTQFYEDVSWENETLEQDCADALEFILQKDSKNLKVIWELPGVQTMTSRKDEALREEIKAVVENASLVEDAAIIDYDDNLVATDNSNSLSTNDFYCEQVLSGKYEVQVVFETELVLAFHHSKPYFEHHVVIIPKKHIDSLASAEAVEVELAKDFLMAIHYVSSKIEKQTGGCRVSSNVGNYQTSKHLHWYVHSGKRLRDEDGTVI